MKYTNKYRLPQWEENDRVMRSDFNNAMASIERGISTAQSAADNAYSPEKMPYAIGSYVGNGEITTIETNFRPRFLIITAQRLLASASYGLRSIMVAGPGLMSTVLTFLDNGFSISNDSGVNANYPQMNIPNTTYHYIAFP